MDLKQHPFEEAGQSRRSIQPCILIIFGATGDLTSRKLMPALYNLKREGQLPSNFACVGFARREKTSEDFRKEMKSDINTHSRVKPIEEELWKGFQNQLFYHQSEFDDPQGYDALKKLLDDLDKKLGTKGNRVFYLSTQPSYFPAIIKNLNQSGLIYKESEDRFFSRVIIEKPFGHDLDSAIALQQELMNHLSEKQLYRIDHYLGKETVQNLLVFRFANSLFENLWNNRYIDHIQITVGEDIGIGSRGRFWEEAGMLRDIIQNHMMQLLSLVTMEPPSHLSADSIRDEKVKVLECIDPFSQQTFHERAVRGQYGRGFINTEPVKGYREEENVSPTSSVETYVALKLFIHNWRWEGVPFYLRGAKRLPKRATEIAVIFKDTPGVLFQSNNRKLNHNVLTIRIQPNEGIALKINSKVPGPSSPIQPVMMDFRYGAFFGLTPPDAYERLICDCMYGDNTLFAREDEVMHSWRVLSPLVHYWGSTPATNFPNYAAGSWGPKEADDMLAKDNRHWRLI
ncbi:MAG: glucose-6-phosphate dehydrogenase [Chlamydiales bacterium]|nr:glucose-6-phosphate dehydrogenase [Chlamydiales bacterium]